MYNFYSDQNVLGSGRWFLSIACGFSSYFDLPWINGLFSIIFIAATTVVIINIFKISNKIIILLTSGFMASFPSVTEIICFEFTADGFFFSMLLSVLAAYILITVRNKWICIITASLLICVSCGIYQAYVSFTLVLLICWLLWNLLTINSQIRTYLPIILRSVISIVIGLIAYYITWKICMSIQGVTVTDNQGISKIGILSLDGFFLSLKSAFRAIITFVIEKNVIKHGIGFYAILNCLFLLMSGIVFALSIVKSKVYKELPSIIAIFFCFIALPFAICMWQFTSPDVIYCIRMMHSIVIVYILVIQLCEKYLRRLSSVFVTFLCVVIIVNFSVRTNIAYYYLNFEYENSYAEALRLENGLENALCQYGANRKIAIIGTRNNEVALDQNTEANGIYAFSSMIEKSFLMDSVHTENFLKNVLYFDSSFASAEEKNQIINSEKFKAMNSWFDGGTIELIDDIVTVKLG